MAVVITRIWRQEEDEKKMLASLYADEKTDLTEAKIGRASCRERV